MDSSRNVPKIVGRIGLNEERRYLQHKRRLMLGFGITEILLGSSCIFSGIASVVTAIPTSSISVLQNFPLSLGEGIWCGLWAVISGSLGVACGRAAATDSLVRAHMALAIIATHFSALLFTLGITWGLITLTNAVHTSAELAGAVLGFVAMVMCIVSASASCCFLYAKSQCECCSCCCDCCCEDSTTDEEQIVYVVQNPPNILNTGPFQTPINQQFQAAAAMAHSYPQTTRENQNPYNPAQKVNQSQHPQLNQPNLQETNFASDQHRFITPQTTAPTMFEHRNNTASSNYINVSSAAENLQNASENVMQENLPIAQGHHLPNMPESSS